LISPRPIACRRPSWVGISAKIRSPQTRLSLIRSCALSVFTRASSRNLRTPRSFYRPSGKEKFEGVMSKSVSFAALMAAAALSCSTVKAEPLFAFLSPPVQTEITPQAVAPAPAEERDDSDAQVDPRLRRQIVDYKGSEAAGTVIVDTPH